MANRLFTDDAERQPGWRGRGADHHALRQWRRRDARSRPLAAGRLSRNPKKSAVELLGRDAVLRADPTNQAVTVTGAAGTAREDWLPHPAISIAQTFVETIRTGAVAPQSLLDARWVLPVLEKVRLAAATGEMVRVGGALRR